MNPVRVWKGMPYPFLLRMNIPPSATDVPGPIEISQKWSPAKAKLGDCIASGKEPSFSV